MTGQTQSNPHAAGTVHEWRWWAQTLGAALAIAMMLTATAAQAKLTACSPPAGTPPVGTINQCCRITKPGDYTVAGPLTSSGGTCIKIVASGVVLDGNGQTITGAGTGVGVRLTPAAAGDVIHDVADISKFKTGILDDAARSVITGTGSSNGTVEQSAGNGILIRANRVYVANLNSDNNGTNGIVVKPLAPALMVSNVYLSNVEASGNGQAGAVLKSLSTSTDSQSVTGDNGTDGTDLIDSVDADIADGYSYGNQGDGIKITGGHDDIVTNEQMGVTSASDQSPNAIGLEVRDSASDTFADDGISYSTGDGMLIVNGKHGNVTDVFLDDTGGNGIAVRTSAFDVFDDDEGLYTAGDGMLIVNSKEEEITYTDFFYADGSGFHLKQTTGSRAYVLGAINNGGAGIWLDGSRQNNVENDTSRDNATSDVYIGCSPAQKPDGTKCASLGLPASNGNRIFQNDARYFASPKPDVGIGIDLGNHHNQVIQNTATGNTEDAVDENPNCDSNLWMLNTLDIAPQSCIH